MSKVKENVIERELVRRVKAAGGSADKVRIIGKRGFFDRLVVLPGGMVFFVECKRPKRGRTSQHQMRYHERYRSLGVAVVLCRDLADIERLIPSKQKKPRRWTTSRLK